MESSKTFPMEIQTTFVSVLSTLKFVTLGASTYDSTDQSIQLRYTPLVYSIDINNAGVMQLPESMMQMPAAGVITPPSLNSLYYLYIDGAS